jgi:phage major head subunit gpT-like protein
LNVPAIVRHIELCHQVSLAAAEMGGCARESGGDLMGPSWFLLSCADSLIPQSFQENKPKKSYIKLVMGEKPGQFRKSLASGLMAGFTFLVMAGV